MRFYKSASLVVVMLLLSMSPSLAQELPQSASREAVSDSGWTGVEALREEVPYAWPEKSGRTGASGCLQWDTWRAAPLNGKNSAGSNKWWARVTNTCGRDVKMKIVVENALCNVSPQYTVRKGAKRALYSYSTCWNNGFSWARVQAS